MFEQSRVYDRLVLMGGWVEALCSAQKYGWLVRVIDETGIGAMGSRVGVDRRMCVGHPVRQLTMDYERDNSE
jgi:hypothetical protein